MMLSWCDDACVFGRERERKERDEREALREEGEREGERQGR